MNTFFPKLLKADPLSDFRLFLVFEDGVQGEVDLSAWAGKGLFGVWKTNPDSFRQVHINTDGKLAWTAELEMDPDAFYLKLTKKTFAQYAGDKSLLRHPY